MREFGDWLVTRANELSETYKDPYGSPALTPQVAQGGMIPMERIDYVLTHMGYSHIVDIQEAVELKEFVSLILPPELRDLLTNIEKENWSHVRVSLIQYKSRLAGEAARAKLLNEGN